MYSCEYCCQTFTRHSAKKRHIDKNCHKRPKIPVQITKRDKIDRMTEVMTDAISSLKDEVRQLREQRVAPTVYNYNNNYTIVVGPDVFNQLASKYGKDRAITLLARSGTSEVAQKLYFTEAPDKYPIACKDINHFRYINDKFEIIDDRGGQRISDVVSTGVRNAMITAANEVIGDDLNRRDQLIDISQIQANLVEPRDPNLVQNLARISFNPSHPFFRES